MSLISESAGIFLASDLTKGVRFQLWPDAIEDTKSVNWANIEIVGRSEPILSYHSSNSQRFAFTLMFVASVDASDQETPEKVKRKVDFLKALTYPVRSKSGYSTYPPTVMLVVGDLINSRCVVNSVSAIWEGPWSIETEQDFESIANVPGLAGRSRLSSGIAKTLASLPIIAKVKIELTAVQLTPLDYGTVASVGDFSVQPRQRLTLSEEFQV